jgi:hypothetical protein
MIDSVTQPDQLPYWMLVFSFVVSSLLALLAIVEVLCRAFRKATLDIVLTRELFFRLLEGGECLYANAVLVAYDAGALVEDMTASLIKCNGATKTFKMRVAQIGEKYRTPEGLYQFSFYSTSPLGFVPPSNPQRQVFVCEHDSYAGATRESFQFFQKNLFQIKEEFSGTIDAEQEIIQQLTQRVQAIVDETTVSIMDKVQLEPGRYTLEVSVIYRQKGRFFPVAKRRTSKAKVEFTVENYARDYMRYKLREFLQGRASQVLLDNHVTLLAPEYCPSEVREDT